MRWLPEGLTEEAFVYRFAEHQHLDLIRVGVEVINIHGLGGLGGERVSTYLRVSSEEEVFAYVTIDFDRKPENLRILQKYAEDKLLPAGFKIGYPDFEMDNFTLQELAEIENTLAQHLDSANNPITAQEIQKEMQSSGKPVGDCIFRNVVRQYHLDPQPRMRWLLEGATEEAFVYRFAEHQYLDLTRMGIEVINIQGLGGLGGERVSTYLRLSSEETLSPLKFFDDS